MRCPCMLMAWYELSVSLEAAFFRDRAGRSLAAIITGIMAPCSVKWPKGDGAVLTTGRHLTHHGRGEAVNHAPGLQEPGASRPQYFSRSVINQPCAASAMPSQVACLRCAVMPRADLADHEAPRSAARKSLRAPTPLAHPARRVLDGTPFASTV